MEQSQEIWRDVGGYEGLYKVSNLGIIKSLERIENCGKGRSSQKEIVLKMVLNRGYYKVNLYKNKIQKTHKVHQLVAIAFLNHIPNGYEKVVNHINHIKTDNRVENLELVSNRENTSLKHIPHSSQYTGVIWHKRNKKYCAQIRINGKIKYLGNYLNEFDAHIAYEKELKKIKNGRHNKQKTKAL